MTWVTLSVHTESSIYQYVVILYLHEWVSSTYLVTSLISNTTKMQRLEMMFYIEGALFFFNHFSYVCFRFTWKYWTNVSLSLIVVDEARGRVEWVSSKSIYFSLFIRVKRCLSDGIGWVWHCLVAHFLLVSRMVFRESTRILSFRLK